MKTSTHAAGNMLDLDAAFGSLEYSEPGPAKQAAAPQRFEVTSSSKAVELETYQPPGMPAGLRGGPGYSDEDAMKVRLEQKEKAAEAEMMKRIKAKEMHMMQQQMQKQQQQLMQQQAMQKQAIPPQQQQAMPQQPQRFQADSMNAEALKRVQHQDQMMRRPESAGAVAPPPPAALGPLASTPSTGVREVRSAGAFSRFSKSLTAEKGSCTWTYVLLGLAFLFIGAIIAVAVVSAKKNAAAPALVFTQPSAPAMPTTMTGGGSITYDLL
jgi:hypothetical protein